MRRPSRRCPAACARTICVHAAAARCRPAAAMIGGEARRDKSVRGLGSTYLELVAGAAPLSGTSFRPSSLMSRGEIVLGVTLRSLAAYEQRIPRLSWRADGGRDGDQREDSAGVGWELRFGLGNQVGIGNVHGAISQSRKSVISASSSAFCCVHAIFGLSRKTDLCRVRTLPRPTSLLRRGWAGKAQCMNEAWGAARP